MYNPQDKCKNCGADYAIHHADTNQCPQGGVEAPIGQVQHWSSTKFKQDPPFQVLLAMETGERMIVDAKNDCKSCRDYTDVLRVPNGWIFYRHYGPHSNQTIVSNFVPETL